MTASASDKTAAEKPVEKTSEKSAPKPEATDSETLTVEAPTSEEIEQARIQRARAQYLTPSARIYRALRSRLLRVPLPKLSLRRQELLSLPRRKRQWIAPRCVPSLPQPTVTTLG